MACSSDLDRENALVPICYDGSDPIFALDPANETHEPDLFAGIDSANSTSCG